MISKWFSNIFVNIYRQIWKWKMSIIFSGFSQWARRSTMNIKSSCRLLCARWATSNYSCYYKQFHIAMSKFKLLCAQWAEWANLSILRNSRKYYATFSKLSQSCIVTSYDVMTDIGSLDISPPRENYSNRVILKSDFK